MEVGREPVCTDVLCPFDGRKEWRESVHLLKYSVLLGGRDGENYPTVGIDLLQEKGGNLYVLTYAGPRLKEGESLLVVAG